MYNNRRTPSLLTRLITGLFIVSITVGVFVIYQRQIDVTQHAPAAFELTPINKPSTAVGQITLTPTKSPITYRIISNKASISAVITELYYATNSDNWDLSHLGAAAGHLEGTPEMGQGGNFVLAGHVELKDGSQGPFADLRILTPCDLLTIIGDTSPTPIVHEYQVTDVGKVLPTDFAVMRNHGYEELTLITCDDYDLQTQTYNSRVIVHARPIVVPTAIVTKTQTKTATLIPKKK